MSTDLYALVEWVAVAAIVGAAALFALRRWWPRRSARRAAGSDTRAGDCGSPASAACTACNGCELASQERSTAK